MKLFNPEVNPEQEPLQAERLGQIAAAVSGLQGALERQFGPIVPPAQSEQTLRPVVSPVQSDETEPVWSSENIEGLSRWAERLASPVDETEVPDVKKAA